MHALGNKKTQWKEDLYFGLKIACNRVCKYYSQVTPEMGMLPVPTQILNPFGKFQPFRIWDKAMDINTENNGSFPVH